MIWLCRIHGTLDRIPADAIVNAANTSLLGGGGVDGAIHRAGGPAILEACRAIVARQGGCKTGEAVITTAGKLPAKYVIHTVGPVWNGGQKGEPAKLRLCYTNSLELAAGNQVTRILFPNISTGVYGYPKTQAAEVAVEAVSGFLADHPHMEVVFVCFDEENLRIYQSLLKIESFG
ncbi:MAG: O-acetyl-ADP-ribose deacetylase [Chitinophagaceae bacterium]|nr:MAG: O-acetyl-ADP-ribose deacetylase [Chitinophagaceae bacterium]